MHRSLRAGVLLALGLAACRDGTGPAPAVSVTITANASEPTVSIDGAGAPQGLFCDVSFHARADVNGDAAAEWIGGKLRYFSGVAGSPPLDSLLLSTTELTRSFGSDVLRGGELRSSSWRTAGPRPFRIEGTFTYRTQGRDEVKAATAAAVCAPGGQIVAGPPPTLSSVLVQGRAGEVEPGDTLTVSWTAGSTTGLWETGVQVTGAFVGETTLAGRGDKSATHSVRVVVPAGAALGMPVQLTVFAVDVSQLTASQQVQRGPVADRTPPQVLRLSTVSSAEPGTALGGQYPAGHTLTLWAAARDNRGGGWIVVESGGTLRDSVAFQPQQAASLPLPRAWVEGRELRVYARDAVGNVTAPFVTPAGAFHFYPDAPAQVATAAVAPGGLDVVLSPDGERLYVPHGLLSRVDVVDLSTMAVTQIPLPGFAGHLDVTPDGRTLVVALAHDRQLAVVDLAGGAVRTVPVSAPGLTVLGGLAVAANGRVLFHGFVGTEIVLFEHDLAAGTTRVRADAPAHALRAGIGRSGDHGRLLVGSGCVYTSATDAFGPCRAMAAPVNGFTGDLAGRRWNSGHLVFGEALEPVEIPRHDALNGSPSATLAPAGTELLVGGGSGLLRVRIADGLVVHRYDGPFIAHGAILVTRDGRRIVTLTNGQVVRFQLP